ncbi:transposase [Agromyces sp. G08B096]|uniref:Transposase n=1 Tax=Agromyces sp. G08B096 TaxID=3156399 RepID=A0AAU7W507_9MICO
MADADALADIADELYGLDADEFTAARNARVKALRIQDRALASRVAEFRKPSTAAWVVNQLARHRPDELDELLALGNELRAAQADLDAKALTALARERRKLVAAMARTAAAVAEELGSPVRPATVEEVAETLQAALTDASAADAVRSGRLVRALEAIGTEVDLGGAVAGGVPRRGGSGAARVRAGGSRSKGDDRPAGPVAVPPPSVEEDARFAARRKAERERAERAAADAEGRAEDAEAAEAAVRERLTAAQEALEAAERERDELEHRLREIESQLADAERTVAEAQRALRPLEREHDRAARSADEARAAADELRAELD